MFKSKWNWLYVILAAVVIFSLFAVPKIATSSMEAGKGQIVSVPE